MMSLKPKAALFASIAAMRMCKSRLIWESWDMASELVMCSIRNIPGVSEIISSASLMLTAGDEDVECIGGKEAVDDIPPKAESLLDRNKVSSRSLEVSHVRTESWSREFMSTASHADAPRDVSSRTVTRVAIEGPIGKLMLQSCWWFPLLLEDVSWDALGFSPWLRALTCAACWFSTVESDILGHLRAPWLAGAARRGLPTLFCCPAVQGRLRSVHRTHLASFGYNRSHLALTFLQPSQENRICDGWTVEAPMLFATSDQSIKNAPGTVNRVDITTAQSVVFGNGLTTEFRNALRRVLSICG